jgi:hypothetical protein
MGAEVALAAGTEVGGIDIRLIAEKPFTLRGHVFGPDSAMRSAVVMVTPMSSGDSVPPVDQAGVRGLDGYFEVKNVPPGTYRMAALSLQGTNEYGGFQVVRVDDRQVSDIIIGLNRAVDVPGRVVVEGDYGLDLKHTRVLLIPESQMAAASAVSNVDAAGRFTAHHVLPQRYVLKVAGMPQPFYVKRVAIANEQPENETADFSRVYGSITVTVSSVSGSVSGVVSTGMSEHSGGAKVVLAPDGDRRSKQELYKITTADQDGRFQFSAVPPGRYDVFAWQVLDPGAYWDPAFLTAYDNFGTPVVVDSNMASSVTVRLAPSQEGAQ